MLILALLAAVSPGPKAVSCSGETTTKEIGLNDTVDPFYRTFIINDAEKTWLLYSPSTGGTEPVCKAPSCSLNYGPLKLIGSEGKNRLALDREAGTFTEIVLTGSTAYPVLTVTKATCKPVPLPTIKNATRKF
jgi:hypothetical protein